MKHTEYHVQVLTSGPEGDGFSTETIHHIKPHAFDHYRELSHQGETCRILVLLPSGSEDVVAYHIGEESSITPADRSM
jgi:hypothetical protein